MKDREAVGGITGKMSVIYEKDIREAATHAIVIGVGAYSHLNGGSGNLFSKHEGMKQLTSPPVSARAFANWMITEFNNPQKPLASLALLVSGKNDEKFVLPSGKEIKLDRANLQNVKKATREWVSRGDKNKDNMMIFYFCGHGIASGYQQALLLNDFGKSEHSPLENSIDFDSFYQGMDKCKATEQCFFIDACRIASPTLIRTHNYAGDPIIEPSVILSPKRRAPIYSATVPGDAAYGRTGSVSVFTEVLIKALKGAGSDNFEGDWRIYTDRLNIGISHLIDRVTTGAPQASIATNIRNFTFHYLKNQPIVPVTIRCKPKEANEWADLSYNDGTGQINRSEKSSTDWEVDLQAGEYQFQAEFQHGRYNDGSKRSPVRPPCRKVPIEVE